MTLGKREELNNSFIYIFVDELVVHSIIGRWNLYDTKRKWFHFRNLTWSLLFKVLYYIKMQFLILNIFVHFFWKFHQLQLNHSNFK